MYYVYSAQNEGSTVTYPLITTAKSLSTGIRAAIDISENRTHECIFVFDTDVIDGETDAVGYAINTRWFHNPDYLEHVVWDNEQAVVHNADNNGVDHKIEFDEICLEQPDWRGFTFYLYDAHSYEDTKLWVRIEDFRVETDNRCGELIWTCKPLDPEQDVYAAYLRNFTHGQLSELFARQLLTHYKENR